MVEKDFKEGQEIYVLHIGVMTGTYLNKTGKTVSCIMGRPAVIRRGVVTAVNVDGEGAIKFREAGSLDPFRGENITPVKSLYSDLIIRTPMQDPFCKESLEDAVAALNRMNEYSMKCWKGKTPDNDSDRAIIETAKDFYKSNGAVTISDLVDEEVGDLDFADAVASIPENGFRMEQ